MSCDTHYQIVWDIYPKNIQAKFNMKKYFPSYRADKLGVRKDRQTDRNTDRHRDE